MPNLDFYAVDDDWSAVLNAVFDLDLFRVSEAYSRPGRGLRQFHTADETVGSGQRHLMLFVTGAGPEPGDRRIDFAPGLSDGGFRYTCEGWGLIQLYHGGFFQGRELRWSHTNHNTAKRAAAWAPTMPRIDDPAAWDWRAVTRASSRLNRAVRRLAVDRVGSRPVLAAAARLIDEAGLRYEHGTGLHATPAWG